MTDMQLRDYLDLPYAIILRRDEDGDFVARVAELPGCSAHGASETDAIANVREAQRLWIEESLSAGQDVPRPESTDDLPSGKWLQRVPRGLHKRLVERAKREGVSLNQLVTSFLAESIGRIEASAKDSGREVSSGIQAGAVQQS